MMKKINLISFFLLLCILFFCCQKPCTNNYAGNWQFTTEYSTNSNPPHNTEQYMGQISILNSDSIHLYFSSNGSYPIDVDCSTGVLDGDIYQGNHGWGYYNGTISNSTINITMVRFGGFPPYDTSYQVISGRKL